VNGEADARLQRLLGGEHLAALRQRLRRRYERGEETGSFRLDKLNAEERAALAGLLGKPPRDSSSLLVDIAHADEALRRSGIADSLRAALERLDGPIVDRAAERLRLQSEWEGLRGSRLQADLAAVLATPSGLGLLKRLARQDPAVAAHLLEQAQAVLHRLPARGLPRAQLAADVLGDAHALDSGNAVATLVLAALRRADTDHLRRDKARVIEVEPGEDAPADSGANSARDLWAGVGVLVNELARPALFLNLPFEGTDSLGSTAGEPAYLSLRSLLRAPPRWQVAGRTVYVCENPNLLAIAADRLGARCAPLICTDGMPAAAQRALLAQLAQAGARLRYHGDFDWPGLAIGNHVLRRYGAAPWRFSAGDYLAAIPAIPKPGRKLEGTPVAALWDAALAPAMEQHRLAVDEEAVAQGLLMDLGSE
jgi:uncharacterized protein (TIGR02679 family)